ncbi:MAG: sulfatase [Armatimonadota bacterium]
MRPLLLLAFLCAAILGGGAAAQRERPARPNLLVILADDLGYGDLSSYGAADLKTPHLDALVADGMRFDRFYANSPVCSPTRASLLTGRYPDLVGVPGVIRTHAENSWGYLSPEAELLPKSLKRAGYHTALVGKWHLGLTPPNTPTDRGFDHFHGFLGDMMDDYLDHRRHGINYMRLGRREIDPPGHATDLFTTWAIDYLRTRAGTRQPFFLYLAYNAPHVPIQPPDAWVDRVKARNPGIDDRRARLAALVEQMDDGIGKVIDALKQSGDYENTLIVFTSDNGGQLSAGASNGPLRGAKEDVYEGGIRVPACAVWPGKIRRGSRSDRVALTMDLFPTLCEAAGVKPPAPVDGVSLIPELTGTGVPAAERTLFWVRREGGARYEGKTIHAVRRGDWKLVHNSPFEPMQLFNLAADPKEQTDVSARNRPVFDELSAALREQIRRAGRVPWVEPEAPRRRRTAATGAPARP